MVELCMNRLCLQTGESALWRCALFIDVEGCVKTAGSLEGEQFKKEGIHQLYVQLQSP